MSPTLYAALVALVEAYDAQERAFRAARAAPQEMYHTRDQAGKRLDPRWNTTAGARIAADKELLHAARLVAALFTTEETHIR